MEWRRGGGMGIGMRLGNYAMIMAEFEIIHVFRGTREGPDAWGKWGVFDYGEEKTERDIPTI